MSYLAGFLLAGGVALVIWFLIEKSRRNSHPIAGGVHRSITLPHTEEVELYSNSFSHCSRKARLVLAELGISYKHHSIDLIETGWYQTLSPAYLKINPAGIVPAMLHEGHPVYESDDILAYAQSIAGPDAPRLVPSDEATQSQMNEWLDFCAISSGNALAAMQTKAGSCIPGLTLPLFVTSIRYIPLRKILIGFLFHFDKKRPALFTASKLLGLRRMMSLDPIRNILIPSRDHMSKHLLKLNTALADGDRRWILGDDYSLADVSIACLLLRMEETGWLAYFSRISNIDAVVAYYDRIKSREAWDEAIIAQAHPIIDKAIHDLAAATDANSSTRALLYETQAVESRPLSS